MKLNYTILCAAAALFGVLSCARLEMAPEGPASEGETLTFSAVWADKGETKTSIHEGGPAVWWDVAEDINLFSSNGGSATFTSTNTEPAASVTFTGQLAVSTGSNEFWAVYPYSWSNSFDGSHVTLTVPRAQTATAGTFANRLFPAIARTTDSNLSFLNVCGGAVFTVTTEGVQSVEFKSLNGESIAGPVTVGFDSDGYPVVESREDGHDTVVVTPPVGDYFVVGEKYYAVFLPGTLSGLTVTVRTAYMVATKTLDHDISVNRSMFGRLLNVDLGAEYVVDPDLGNRLKGKTAWINNNLRIIAAGGNYNWNDAASDTEYYPENRSGNGAIGYMLPSTVSTSSRSGAFNNLYSIITECREIMNALPEITGFTADLASGNKTDLTRLFRDCQTITAYCYYELVRHFGDVPRQIYPSYPGVFPDETGLPYASGLTLCSRFDLIDEAVALLKEAEPHMDDLGSGGVTAEQVSRTFACELIADLNLLAGSYQTIRTDIDGLYGEVQFDQIATGSGSIYARRTDWNVYYTEAAAWYEKVLGERKGSAGLITVDDRAYASNPFQRNFQYIMDNEISPESIFEVACSPGMQSERPYSQGRPSNGATRNAAPCKVFGGIRVIPTFYYQGYEDSDLRWDASAVVTGSDGKGNEAIVNLSSGSRLRGGIAINKWDINKMKIPYVTQCRQSGMSYQQFRIPQTMLRLAEVDAALGQDTRALELLNQLRIRARVSALSALSGDALIDAVIAETKRECLGEGDTRYVEIRTGKIVTLGRSMRAELRTVIDDLARQGYHTFANGRTISAYIWTKPVDLSGNNIGVLTYNSDNSNPALIPGWRGVYDYTSTSSASAVEGSNHNLAIRGLFEFIDPNGSEAAALVADGYTMVPWGIDMVNERTALWDYNMLSGVELSNVPFYFSPLPVSSLNNMNNSLTNGYGYQ